MATAPINATADTLEALTRDLHDLVFDYREPARSHRDVEDRIERGERIAGRIRDAVRGRVANAPGDYRSPHREALDRIAEPSRRRSTL